MTETSTSMVLAKLDGARAQVAALEVETAELALEAVEGKPGAAGKLVSHRDKLATYRQHAGELLSALDLAKSRDGAADAEEHYRHLLVALEQIKKAFKARDAAGARFCKAAEEIVAAYKDLLTQSYNVENLVPRELGMRPGFALQAESIIDGRAFPCGLDGLVAAELYRNSGTRRPGQSDGILPKAAALNITTVLAPERAESMATSLPRVTASHLATIAGRIEEFRRP
jgi:hypothetical protein